MLFQESLKQIQILLQKELVVYFKKKRREAKKIHPELVSLVDQISDLTLRGGKRIRPFLCWLGHKAVDGSSFIVHRKIIQKELIDAMMGLELFHSFALIHDDIIDKDDARRGGDTIHEHFIKESLKFKVLSLKLRQHFGTSMAILAGDLVLSWADECFINVENMKVSKAYQQMKEQVIFGQSLDVMKHSGFTDISKDKVNELKTAWYSVVWPLTIGAFLANAQPKEIVQLQQYGLLVGQAFQLRDDLMDGDIGKEDFILQTKEYKRNVEKAIEAFHGDDQKKKLLLDVATFVIVRHS